MRGVCRETALRNVRVGISGVSPGIANAASDTEEEPPPSALPTALLVGGHGGYNELTDEQMATAFGGYFAEYTRVNVPFPGTDDWGFSIGAGTDALYNKVKEIQLLTPREKITIGGASQGAPVVDEVLRRLASDEDRPGPDDLTAVIYADITRQRFTWGAVQAGYRIQPPPETDWDVIVIVAEYDGIGDFPDNPFNLLAVLNAYMAVDQLHVSSGFVDFLEVVPPENITVTTNSKGGTTTSYLTPTPVLPLLQPLVEDGVSPSVISALDALLRPIVDSAYLRTWSKLFGPATASTSTSVPNEPPNLEATTLTLTSGSTPPAPASAPPGSDTAATPARQGLDTAEANGSDQADERLANTATRSATATDGLAQAEANAFDQADQGLGTARDAATTERPDGGTDLTDGNKVEPGQSFQRNPTEHTTDVVEDVQEKVTTETSDADDGLANADDDVNNAGPSGGDPGTGAADGGGE
jgi:hypothetical protein